MRKLNIIVLACLSLVFANSLVAQVDSEDLTQYVDPFVGTQEMGHTFPGACVPFGMVQLSPDTDTIPFSVNGRYNKDVYRYCAGYQYADKSIVGFSHTHLSGTGHSDLGDFLLMPTVGSLHLNPGTIDNTRSGYRSMYRHETEMAQPGYYKVDLDDYGVKAELTATSRTGFHKYTFPKSDSAHIILDLTHGIYNYPGKVLWSHIRVENDTLVTGYRITRGWARTNYLYFAMTFSKPIKNYGCQNKEKVIYNGFWRKFKMEDNFPEMAGKNLTAYFDFSTQTNEKIKVKFALSPVSCNGALNNLRTEIPHFDFEKVRALAKDTWQKELERIKVTASDSKKTTFYTCLYHSYIHPEVYMDVDGKYRGLDHNIYQADGFVNYSVFSLWDTYRAQHPLMTLIQPDRTSDMVRSLLAHQDQSVHHLLPIWSHFGNENWCMIGYHAVPVIVDAYMKGIKGFDARKALVACVATATHKSYDHIGDYMRWGYVPHEKSSVGASITLEYAYDDWTISQMAQKVGAPSIASAFEKRAHNWENLFDDESGFVRAKRKDGTWKTPFDPLQTHGEGFIEGNSWNYSLYVPHDVSQMISRMGGDNRFCEHLDSLFSMYLPDKYFANTEDITRDGLMGCYVHGNEPSHHVAYLYNWAGKPWKTQERIHEIINSKYLNKPDGLCGNDDCGQMSAWYLFSSMGFYPVCPGSNQYIIGSPSVKEARIDLGNGKFFTVKADNFADGNIYIRSVTLNGKPWNKVFISHDDMINGGELVFKMSRRPNKKWGVNVGDHPYSVSDKKQ